MNSLKTRLLIPFASALLLMMSFITPDGKDSLSVKKGTITINGVKFTPGWDLSTATMALGVPDRSRDGYNKTHTYDTKGIVLFEKMSDKTPSGKVSEIQYYVSMAPEPNNVTPKGYCTTPIKIDKLSVTSNLSATEMMKKLKGWTKTDSYMEHNYRMASKGLYVYFLFNDSETQLIKISVGPDKR